MSDAAPSPSEHAGARALVLDFDGSVADLPEATTIDLRAEEDAIRYGCSLAELDRLAARLDAERAPLAPVTFLGSGDFHHVTLPLLRRRRERGRFQVVVFDNHPDNMWFPWGVHCGSWVHHACALPFVSRITVIGITSTDVAATNLWQNHLRWLYAGKLTYLCLGDHMSRLHRWLALPGFVELGAERARLPAAIAERVLGACRDPIYLSIDKDVLAPEAVATNWDQGTMTEREMMDSIARLRPSVFAADVTGEISFFHYSRRWKRLLARLDGQEDRPPADLERLRQAQLALDRRLVALITAPA